MTVLERVSAEEIGLDPALSERLRAFFERRYLRPGLLPCAATLVARGDKVGLLEVQGMADAASNTALQEDSIFRIYSMTKPIVSVAAMTLYEKGYFLLEDPIQKYLPEFAKTRVWAGGSWPNYLTRRPDRPITVRDLMTHCSGLTYDFMYRSNVDYGYRKLGLGALHSGDRDLKDTCEELARLPLEFSPGEHWNYSMATDVLGRLIEVISRTPLDTFLEENIFAPLGMVDTGFHVPADKLSRLTACYERPPGSEAMSLQDGAGKASNFSRKPQFLSGGGGLVSTLGDYHRFAAMLANGGTLQNVRILGPRTLELMMANHLPDGQDMTTMGLPSTFTETPYRGVGFGLGFYSMLNPAQAQMTAPLGEAGWGGLASTSFWVAPRERLSVVFMTQLIPSSSTSVRRELHAMIYGHVQNAPCCCCGSVDCCRK